MARKRISSNRIRTWFQLAVAAISNSFITGFKYGTIYKGSLKKICLPGLNCYSCPGAIAACPIGSLQQELASIGGRFPAYVAGFLIFFGAVFGRFVCGWLCPFGLFQDLLHKIPFIKKLHKLWGDRILRALKYLILLAFVLVGPVIIASVKGVPVPLFCKYICPAGSLEAGIPLLLLNKGLRSLVSFIYAWKMLILLVLVVLSLMVYRPFCKFLCPLGAIYGLFNKIALYSLEVDDKACINCGRCAEVCPMGCDPVQNSGDRECIRCGKCKDACPTGAIRMGFGSTCMTAENQPQSASLGKQKNL